jgi:hypothetical protein
VIVAARHILVFDAGPLVSFACIESLDVLGEWAQAHQIAWPAAVRGEIARKSHVPGFEKAADVLKTDWLPEPEVLGAPDDLRAIDEIRWRLASRADPQTKHAGEAAAIHLARKLTQRGQAVFLTGDWDAGDLAKASFGLQRLMTLELIIVLVHQGLVTSEQAWDMYVEMRKYSKLPDMAKDAFMRLCPG